MTQTRSGSAVTLRMSSYVRPSSAPGSAGARPAANGDDHSIRSPGAAVGRGDRVGVEEADVAGSSMRSIPSARMWSAMRLRS